KTVGTELAVLAHLLAGDLAEHFEPGQRELRKAAAERAGADLIVAQPPTAEAGAVFVDIRTARLKQIGS
ncbi:hypothetical protein K7459_29375, partial [Pseudomonas fluorescens]|nr:hypothetical protein [Pseudomonas fluorescens]